MEPIKGLRHLFLLRYQDETTGEFHTKPFYALAALPATQMAMDWILEHPTYNYIALTLATEETSIIDGVAYPLTRFPSTTRYLYVHSWVNKEGQIKSGHFYSINDESARHLMKEILRYEGLEESAQKTFYRSEQGEVLDHPTFYPATKEEEDYAEE